MTVVDRLNVFGTAGGSLVKFGSAIKISWSSCFSSTLVGSKIKSGALISFGFSAATGGDVFFADTSFNDARFGATASLTSFALAMLFILSFFFSFDSIVIAFSSFLKFVRWGSRSSTPIDRAGSIIMRGLSSFVTVC